MPDKMLVRFRAGTLDRVATIAGKMKQATFIREAVERELTRREKSKPKAD